MAQVSAIGSGLEAVLPQAGPQSPSRTSGGEAFDTVLAREIEGRSAEPSAAPGESAAPAASSTGADAADRTSGSSFTETLDQAVSEGEGTGPVEGQAEGAGTASRVDWEGLMWEILALVLGQGAQAPQTAEGSEGAQGEAAALEGDTSGPASTPGAILRKSVADWLASPEENAPPPELAKILDGMGLPPSEVADFVKRIRAYFHAAARSESQAATDAAALEGLEGSLGQVAGIAESQAGGGPQTDSSSANATGGTSATPAAAGADGAKETTSVLRSSAVQQVVETIRALPARAGTTEVRLNLVPESLGSVRVTLFVDDQSVVRATFVTDNPLSRAILEAGGQQLRDALREQGFTVDQFTVLVGGEQDSPREREELAWASGESADNAGVTEEATFVEATRPAGTGIDVRV
jgi:flagellar hook-length control protein FliK